MMQEAVQYLDKRIEEDYKNLREKKVDVSKNHLTPIQIHYLYARSYFKDIPVTEGAKGAFNYYLGRSKKYWLENPVYMKALIALALSRNNDAATANDILKSLKENSQYSEELGRYWKDNIRGYFWTQASIECQAALIEAFHDIANDTLMVDEMQRWLLKNKQTNDWRTTKATAEACFALLLRGTDYLAESRIADITIGRIKVDPAANPDLKAEAGTGYFKMSWTQTEINASMGDVTVKN
jgi:hypothetical protein